MTRREYIAEQLLNPDMEYNEDSTYTFVVGHFMKCPYFSEPEVYRCEAMNWEVCVRCKDAWLGREVDV